MDSGGKRGTGRGQGSKPRSVRRSRRLGEHSQPGGKRALALRGRDADGREAAHQIAQILDNNNVIVKDN